MPRRLLTALLACVGCAGLMPGTAWARTPGPPQVNPRPTPVAAESAAPSSGSVEAQAIGLPTIGASWQGAFDPNFTPPDPNGAIGPSSYVEIVNSRIAIYRRTGAVIAFADLGVLTGHPYFNLGDSMVLWDPDTQRFYYNVWDVGDQTMAWGFSKTSNPTAIPSSFCNYTANFGYAPDEYPDYPKLGQTKDFLLIGINHYPNPSAQRADRSDVLWIDKPQGSAPMATCPPASTFLNGKFANLRNPNGTQAWTPVPAIQDDPSSTGFVVTSTDTECPPDCGRGNRIIVHTVTPSAANPRIPTMNVTGRAVPVPLYEVPQTAIPQRATTSLLDPLDARLTHAVSAFDPRIGKTVVWTGHTVNSAGDRTEFRWYEIVPTPLATPTLAQSGVVSDPSLYVSNGALAPDRTVNPSGAAHGDAIVIGFSTSSATTFPAVQMVSKIGAQPASAFRLVHQATSADNDFSCDPVCRWGDYGGATSDPAQSLTAPHGEVWLTQENVTSGANTSWNWEARP